MMKKENTKILSPKLDVVFQKLFGEEGSENITKDFIEAVLEKRVEKIDLNKNPILRRENIGEKLGVLDVIAKINGEENVNIEIQVRKKGQERERILYYWSRIYTKEIKKGNDYQKLDKTIVIMITDFEIEGIEELGMHTKWQIKDETGNKILTKKLEIHIIELPKIKREENMNNKLLDWLTFIVNPNSERVINKMVENKNLKEAKEKLDKMSEDERMQKIAEWREKAILEEKALYHYAMTNGREEGREQGIKEGMKEGIKEGRKEGEKKQKEEIARKMLNKGMDIETIMEVTGLAKEKIKKL